MTIDWAKTLKSPDLRGSLAFLFFALWAFGVFEGPPNPKVTVYLARCKDAPGHASPGCTAGWASVPPVTYVASLDSQIVVELQEGAVSPARLDACVVFDALNWSCGSVSALAPGGDVVAMHRGNWRDARGGSGARRQVSWLQWQLVRLGVPGGVLGLAQ